MGKWSLGAMLAVVLVLMGCSAPGSPSEPFGLVLYQDEASQRIAILDVPLDRSEALPSEVRAPANLRWRPDGASILARASVRGTESVLLAIDLEGTAREISVLQPDDAIAAWAPDCTAFVVRRIEKIDGRWRSSLWRVPLDGSVAVELVDMFGIILNPDWSRDGQTIVFESGNDREDEIWAVNADGRNLRRLIGVEDGQGTAPRLSRDGQRVAFIRQVDDAAQIFVQPLDGGDPAQLTNASSWVTGPVWSPDSAWIAFADQTLRIQRVSVDGHHMRMSSAKGYPADWASMTDRCGGDPT